MKGQAKLIAIGIFLSLLLGYFAFFTAPAQGLSVRSVTPAAYFDGAGTYAAHCAACHGADGRARTAKGKRTGATDFTGSDWNADESRGVRIITNGKGEMPSFKGKISPAKAREVFRYILGFRR